jgi:hypothetical protein
MTADEIRKRYESFTGAIRTTHDREMFYCGILAEIAAQLAEVNGNRPLLVQIADEIALLTAAVRDAGHPPIQVRVKK